MYREKEQLFSRRITLTPKGAQLEGTSRKGTIIALMGLISAAQSGAATPFDVSSACHALLRDSGWVKRMEDLGLLTWFIAKCFPDRLREFFDEFDLKKAIQVYPDGRQGCTLGLSWFLTGIAEARLACGGAVPDLTDTAVDVFRLLQNNQGESGIFGRRRTSWIHSDGFWSRFGTLADQMYAIHALTKFAAAFQIEEPLASALACGNSIRALQGEQGQWWFLYDRRYCRVVNRYPVMSLHQNGIVPLALFSLEGVTGQKFQDSIHRGLSWVRGENELGQDLRDLDAGVIWDSIGLHARTINYWEVAHSYLNGSRPLPRRNLRIRFEARPDHFGWLLYCFGSSALERV